MSHHDTSSDTSRRAGAIASSMLVFSIVALTAVPAQAQRTAPAGPATAAERRASFEAHQALDAASPFRGLEWRSIGPSIQGGRVVDIESVPEDPFTFYIAIASGGVWKTENNGGSFEPLFDDQATIICGDLAIDPRDSKKLWLGTGENNSSRSSYGGFGVYASNDGGRSWTHRGLEDTDRIARILVDPRDSKRVYVAALGKLYTPGGQRGVYRTTDGGETWKAVLPGGDGFTGAIDLVMDPTNPRTLYAAMWERSRRPWNFVEGGAGSGIYKSTDGGDTWTRLAGGFPQTEYIGRIGLSISPAKPRRVYAVVDNQEPLPEEEWDLGTSAVNAKRLRTMSKEEFLRQDPDEIDRFARSLDVADDLDGKKLKAMVKSDKVTIEQLLDALGDANANLFESDIRGLQVWRSEDAGATWRVAHDEPLNDVVFTYGYYFGQLRTDPKDADRLYVTGVPMIASTDGGKTFTGIADRSVHVDHHEMWIDPNHPNRIIAGNDGGLDVSHDYGKTWARMDKMALAQFYTIELDDARPYNVYGGTQDNGTLKGSSRAEGGDDSWEFIGGGDGMYVQVDPRDGTQYVGYQFGFYNRRGPGGGSVRPQRKLLEPALRYNWCTPIQLSSHNQDIVWFGANKLFRSMNQGRTWTAISPDLTRSPNRGDVPYGTISTVAESTLHFGLLWVGTDDGQVHVTKDGGATWTDVGSGLPADRWVTRVTPSRVERDRCYLSLSGYRDDDITAYLYVTDDLGATWRSIATGLPAEAVNVVREDPKNADMLWVGTDRGVYVSLDRGSSWNALPAEIPNVPVHDLQIHERDREVVAGTHGRGAYVLDAEPVQKLTDEIREKALYVFAKPELRHRGSWSSQPSPWYPNPDGPPTTSFTIWSKDGGTLRATILDDEDQALAHFETDVVAGIDVIEWDLLLDEALAIPVEKARVAKKAEERAKDTEAEADASDADANDTDSSDGDTDDDRSSDKDDASDAGSLADVPWAEALRLGRRLAVTPGRYKLKIELGDATASRSFVVK